MMEIKEKEYLIYLLEKSITTRNAAYDGREGKKLRKKEMEWESRGYRSVTCVLKPEDTPRNKAIQKVIYTLRQEIEDANKPYEPPAGAFKLDIDIPRMPFLGPPFEY